MAPATLVLVFNRVQDSYVVTTKWILWQAINNSTGDTNNEPRLDIVVMYKLNKLFTIIHNKNFKNPQEFPQYLPTMI